MKTKHQTTHFTIFAREMSPAELCFSGTSTNSETAAHKVIEQYLSEGFFVVVKTEGRQNNFHQLCFYPESGADLGIQNEGGDMVVYRWPLDACINYGEKLHHAEALKLAKSAQPECWG